MSNRGSTFIISGPAGSGKTTLIDMLHQEFPEAIKNISFTTRPQRPGEVEGIDYFFIKPEEFDKKIKENELLEFVNLFNYKYGTSRVWIEEKVSKGFSVFLVIDIQGAMKVKNELQAPTIFIRPPTLDALKTRLLNRETEKPEQIKQRLERASSELEKASLYDYQITNDDLETAYIELKKIYINLKGAIDGKRSNQ